MEHRDIELGFLGALLKKPANIGTASEIVQPEDFDWIPYRNMYRSMLDLNKAGLGIDSITLGDKMASDKNLAEFCLHYSTSTVGRDAIVKVREDGKADNAISYAKIAKNYAQNRAILQIASECAQWVSQGRDTSSILRDMSSKLSAIQPYGNAETIRLNEAISRAMDITDKARDGQIAFLQTGLRHLDQLIIGLSAPDLTIVAARPGVGKTAFLATVVYNVMRHFQDKTVVFFTLEMGSEQVAMRFISMASGITYAAQRTGKFSEGETEQYYPTVGDLTAHDYHVHLNDIPAIKPSKIRQELRKFPKVDLVVIDYIQLAESDEKKESRHLEVGSVSRALKAIAKEFHTPVLAAAQLSRASSRRSEENSKPVMSDLAESGSLERDADNIIFLHREFGDTITSVILAKQRNGPVGEVFVNYDMVKTLFVDKA